MTVRELPIPIEFTGGANIAFRSLNRRLQNKFYDLLSQYIQDKGILLKNSGILKNLSNPNFPNTYAIRLDKNIQAIIQPQLDSIWVLDILDLRLAKIYFG